MTSNKTKIFVDGQHGTTGLQIIDRLKDRADIELLELPMADRKDLGKRAEIAKASDITVLCLPDAAAKDQVSVVLGFAPQDGKAVNATIGAKPGRCKKFTLKKFAVGRAWADSDKLDKQVVDSMKH